MKNNSNKLAEAELFYKEKIKKWMIGDLKRSIEAKTNFLTALGCLVYTEAIGYFLPPLRGESGSKKSKAFYRCFFRLKSEDYLKNIDKGIKKDTGKNLYEHLRHNMAHIYLPSVCVKKNGQILFLPTIVARDGFFKVDGKMSTERTSPIYISSKGLTIANRNYIIELEEAVDSFYTKTFIKKEKKYQLSAERGIDYLSKRITTI